jgi:hypothetical protein
MELEKPALANAAPGQPITAQAWNTLTEAISALFDALATLDEGTTLRATVVKGGSPVLDARVVASNGTEAVEAVLPFGGSNQYVLGGLRAGAWTVTVSGPGIKAKDVPVTMPSDAPLSVAVDPDGKVAMPDLFSLSGKEAVTNLAAAKIAIKSVFTVTGQEVTRTSLGKENADAIVLHQLPTAESLVDPKQEQARLVISALERDLIAVPDVTGLTLAAAKTLIEKAGLVLGEVAFVEPSPGPQPSPPSS